MSNFETGTFSNVFMGDQGQVTKITRHAFQTLDAANDFCDRLEAYHRELVDGPIDVAGLQAVEILEAFDGFRVQHEMDFVAGDHLHELPFDERRQAISGLITVVAEAPTRDSAGKQLWTPIDGKARNFRGEPPVLIDISPPFSWGEDGLLLSGLGVERTAANREEWTRDFGEKSGVIAGLLRSAMPPPLPGERPTQYITRLIEGSPDWYTELLPGDLPPDIRTESVERLMQHLGLSRILMRDAELNMDAAGLGIDTSGEADAQQA